MRERNRCGLLSALDLTQQGQVGDCARMLSSLVPGLRELRAPLTSGYLWLVLAWMAFRDRVPTRAEVDAPALDRLYELQPLITQFGTLAAVSVAAYVVGSLAIDIVGSLGEMVMRKLRPGLWMTDAGKRLLDDLVVSTPALSRDSALRWIQGNREFLKTQLLDLNPALHSEVDRPDAEAAFRWAACAPLTLIFAYLAATVSLGWLAGEVLPLLLGWQSLTMTRSANGALVIAIAAREDLLGALRKAASGPDLPFLDEAAAPLS
jgi:hypothetical protein